MSSLPPLALLPLDERPVNVQLPQDVAAIAGAVLWTPPSGVLPSFRTPGDTGALADWLEALPDQGAAGAVVSLDMLVYGGLIPSRTSADGLLECLERLERLAGFRRRHPEFRLDVVGLFMRASSSGASIEEPDYWPVHGPDLHALGGTLHRLLGSEDLPPAGDLTSVPDRVVDDFERRRLRNHMVNLRSLELADDGILDTLALTADDTAEHSAGSAEQTWLRHWIRALPGTRGVRMYPGADEVGATLVASALARQAPTPPRIHVACARPESLDRIPPYENQPFTGSIARQLDVAGAIGADTPAAADAVLVLHGPAPAPAEHTATGTGGDPDAERAPAGDPLGRAPDADPEVAASQTCALVGSLLEAGYRVALADVRHPNGADPALTRSLEQQGLLLRLEAYSAWNTAGNTLGSAISLVVAGVVGRNLGTLSERARRIALLRRLLDDHAYQSVLRPRHLVDLFHDSSARLDPAEAAAAAQVIRTEMAQILAGWLDGRAAVDPSWDLHITDLTLPWDRSFEVAVELGDRPGAT